MQKFVKAGEIPELTRKRKWVIGIFITTFDLLIFVLLPDISLKLMFS
ncbi:hypothetical protein [Spiroplasma mirum]|nr:hypothetical protein [Spiroplasma mirum]